jgi:hypothetical protein
VKKYMPEMGFEPIDLTPPLEISGKKFPAGKQKYPTGKKEIPNWIKTFHSLHFYKMWWNSSNF